MEFNTKGDFEDSSSVRAGFIHSESHNGIPTLAFIVTQTRRLEHLILVTQKVIATSWDRDLEKSTSEQK